MTCNWRWFIHPATAISTNRNGSRVLGISLVHYRQHLPCGKEAVRIQADPISGPYGNRWMAVEVSGAGPARESGLVVALPGGRRIEVGRGFDARTLAQL